MYATITKTGRIWDWRRIRRQAGCLQTIPPWEAQSDLSHDSAACIIATDWPRRLAALHFGTSHWLVVSAPILLSLWDWDQLDLQSGSRAHRKFEDPAARVNSLFCARKVLMNYRVEQRSSCVGESSARTMFLIAARNSLSCTI